MAQPFGQYAVPGCHECVNTAAIHEAEVRQVDHNGGTRAFDQGFGQPIGGDDVQLTMQRHNVDIRYVVGGEAELGNHGEAISAEGCRWQGARGSISSANATPI